jgi:hypothetical protein
MKNRFLLALVLIVLSALLPAAAQAYAGTPDIGAIGPTSAEPCQRPPDDYRRTTINGYIINVRTLWMLRLADKLYEGPGSPLRVVQGSYTDKVDASFGTHAGGGAVDISIRAKAAPHDVLPTKEANKLVAALRNAGFAAWLRLPDDLDPPATLHIHAIAVGDRELSEAAQAQVTGPIGYLAGYDGVPEEHGGTKRDRHGGPIVCDWMTTGAGTEETAEPGD